MSENHIQQSIEGVIKYLSEHPDECRYTDKTATAVVEEGLRCRAEGASGATLISDMPKAIGGGGAAPSPGWLFRAALANCDATLIAMRAAQTGVTLTTLEVTVDSESDDRGLLGIMTPFLRERSACGHGYESGRRMLRQSAYGKLWSGQRLIRQWGILSAGLSHPRQKLKSFNGKQWGQISTMTKEVC